jgi:hypothetical protein
VIVLAGKLGAGLEAAFTQTMDGLARHPQRPRISGTYHTAVPGGDLSSCPASGR